MDINEQRCPNCAGKLQTDFDSMKKECPFCGAVFAITKNVTPDISGISFGVSNDEKEIIDTANSKFSVKLLEVGPNKVKAIKILRELTGLGLKEAKDMIDAAPIILLKDADKEEANHFANVMKNEVQGIVLEVMQ